jgi:hypothetical protein
MQTIFNSIDPNRVTLIALASNATPQIALLPAATRLAERYQWQCSLQLPVEVGCGRHPQWGDDHPTTLLGRYQLALQPVTPHLKKAQAYHSEHTS